MTADAAAIYLPSAVVIGLGATLFIDLWALFLKRAFGTPSANYCLVGRWFRHMSEGRFMHANIANSTQKSFECAAGWIAHYVIGVIYGLVLVALASVDWLTRLTFLPELLFGVCTVLIPFLVTRPSFEIGRVSQGATGRWMWNISLLSLPLREARLWRCPTGFEPLRNSAKVWLIYALCRGANNQAWVLRPAGLRILWRSIWLALRRSACATCACSNTRRVQRRLYRGHGYCFRGVGFSDRAIYR